MTNSSADSPALTRGFLFCDLRDYTAFVEAHGDQAAAELLGDYRAIVRDALGATGGGEVRTEGDSFYIVFSSVGAAVRCGLAIVAEAGRASAARADRPIRVGVGVHAGESVAEGEGFVGSAVNIAARICALAAPGEVLVSDTVRSLVRTSLPLTFRSRGRPKLKGIAEPIELFAVTPAVETTAVRQAPAARPSRRRLIVVGLGALIVIALAGPLGASVLLRPSEAGNPSPSPGPGHRAESGGCGSLAHQYLAVLVECRGPARDHRLHQQPARRAGTVRGQVRATSRTGPIRSRSRTSSPRRGRSPHPPTTRKSHTRPTGASGPTAATPPHTARTCGSGPLMGRQRPDGRRRKRGSIVVLMLARRSGRSRWTAGYRAKNSS